MIDPIAIHDFLGIQGLDIHWYGIIVCLGIIAGVYIACRLAKRRGYNYEMIVDFMILALPLAIICARLYYVAFEWERYAADPISIVKIWEGGLAIYGGIIGALIAVVIFCKWKKIPMGDLLDCGAPGLILGQAIGRWANFVNQEAFGNAITNASQQWFPFGVYIERAHTVFDPATSMWVECTEPWHLATFFYESVWNLLVFGALYWYFKRVKHKGNVFAAYLILYGFGRFFIEGLRTDSLWMIPGVIRVSQLLSALFVIGGAIYLIIMHKKEPKLRVYNGKYTIANAMIAKQEEAYKKECKKNGIPYVPREQREADKAADAAENADTETDGSTAPDITEQDDVVPNSGNEAESTAVADDSNSDASETKDK